MNTIRFYFEPIEPMDLPSKVAIQVAQWAAVTHIGQAMGFMRGREHTTEYDAVRYVLDCPNIDEAVRFADRVERLGLIMEKVFYLCECSTSTDATNAEQLHLAATVRLAKEE